MAHLLPTNRLIKVSNVSGESDGFTPQFYIFCELMKDLPALHGYLEYG